jgi:hypothetical protein
MGETRHGYSRSTQDAGSRYAERRSVPRYRATAGVEVFEPLANVRLLARLSEISLHGGYVSGPEPLPCHSVFQMRIVGDSGVVEAWARVVYVHPGVGMGVSFLKIEEKHVDTLKRWLDELAAAAGESAQ